MTYFLRRRASKESQLRYTWFYTFAIHVSKVIFAYPLLTVLSMDKQLSRANMVVKACCMNSGVCGAAAARARCGCGAGAAQTAAIS